MPVHAVPKPHSTKLRLVNDQSAGAYSLNAMISPDSIKGAVLDGVPVLGDLLRSQREKHGPHAQLIVWKSDVSQAYRRIPVSPYWQVRQVVTIDNMRHVDRCNCFGGRGSLRIWAAFMSLVEWIAVEKREIDPFAVYVDDSAGFALLGDVQWYAPYSMYMPTQQARLLTLWDDIGIPHERPKQLADLKLPYIGFLIDPNRMSVTLPDVSKSELLRDIEEFASLAPGKRRRTLAEFQAFAGYVNWCFNVFPLLQPALARVYDKMAGKSSRHAGIYLNQGILGDLRWLADHVRASPGVLLLDACAWTPADLVPGSHADEFALCDASGVGLGIYFPWLRIGLHVPLPTDAPTGAIFFHEALAACAAIHRTRYWRHAGRTVKRLAILSDNSNTVGMFNTLRAAPVYNSILKSSVDVMLQYELQVRVDHVPGELNIVADALSRGNLELSPSRRAGGLIIMNLQSRRLRQPIRQPWSRERLAHERAILLGHALDTSTKKNYSSALNSYLAFVHMHHFPIEPTPDTLSLFATELEPWFPDVRQARKSPIVARTLKGGKRLFSKPIQWKRALTKHDLGCAATHFRAHTYDDKLFLAALFTGFHALLRLGELVWPDQCELQSYRKLTMRNTVVLHPDRFEYTLPTHKADPFFEGSKIIVHKTANPPDPLQYFLLYLQARDATFPLRPELWVRLNGSIPT
ncbi:hypothetical protein OH77DRAFT_1524983 [Trametes cingulata]|nr:hypothetical protein OH77DRAFT_1524983 [Trametes cingulata]